jgi:hypothetical protein
VLDRINDHNIQALDERTSSCRGIGERPPQSSPPEERRCAPPVASRAFAGWMRRARRGLLASWPPKRVVPRCRRGADCCSARLPGKLHCRRLDLSLVSRLENRNRYYFSRKTWIIESPSGRTI